MFVSIRKIVFNLTGLIPAVRRKREAAAKAAAEALRLEEQRRQKQLGEIAVKKLRSAIKQNPVHSTQHKVHKCTGPMELYQRPKGALGYSIDVFVGDRESLYGDRAFVVLQCNISVEKNEISCWWGFNPKLKEDTVTLDHFEWLVEKMCRRVQGYRLFVSDGAEGPSLAQAFGLAS